MRYRKDTPRITVKFIDVDTDQILFEIKDRSWMNVGELFTDQIVTTLMEQENKSKKQPKNILVLAVGEFTAE